MTILQFPNFQFFQESFTDYYLTYGSLCKCKKDTNIASFPLKKFAGLLGRGVPILFAEELYGLLHLLDDLDAGFAPSLAAAALQALGSVVGQGFVLLAEFGGNLAGSLGLVNEFDDLGDVQLHRAGEIGLHLAGFLVVGDSAAIGVLLLLAALAFLLLAASAFSLLAAFAFLLLAASAFSLLAAFAVFLFAAAFGLLAAFAVFLFAASAFGLLTALAVFLLAASAFVLLAALAVLLFAALFYFGFSAFDGVGFGFAATQHQRSGKHY